MFGWYFSLTVRSLLSTDCPFRAVLFVLLETGSFSFEISAKFLARCPGGRADLMQNCKMAAFADGNERADEVIKVLCFIFIFG